jgi:hypothetical protein
MKAKAFRFPFSENGVHGLRLDTAFAMPYESRIGKKLITGVTDTRKLGYPFKALN